MTPIKSIWLNDRVVDLIIHKSYNWLMWSHIFTALLELITANSQEISKGHTDIDIESKGWVTDMTNLFRGFDIRIVKTQNYIWTPKIWF